MASQRPRYMYTALFGAGIVAIIAGGIAFIDWTRDKPHSPHATSSPVDDPESDERKPPVVAPIASPHGQPADSAEPAAELLFDPREMPPPADAGAVKDRPERKELTEEETRAKKQQALELLDRAIERLEKERAALETAGNVDEAKHVKVRLDRMRKLREKRAAELDGGADAD